MVNFHVFAKHVLWHTTLDAAAADVAASLEDDSRELASVFDDIQNELDVPLPTTTTNTRQSADGGYKSFVASSGWCSRFLTRNELGNYMLTGEKASNDYPAAEKFRKDFTTYLAECPEISVKSVITIVINFDEGGVQFRSLPQRGYVDKKLVIKAKKPIKSRITVMFGSSMAGHKFKLVVIGKAKNPRCFKNIDKSNLPVIYYNSPTAWMTKEIFYDWFFVHFAPEVQELYGDQTVHVLLDNCRAHPSKEMLDSMYPNIKVWMLPPNTTAILQPMDMGLIYTAKAHFKLLYYT